MRNSNVGAAEEQQPLLSINYTRLSAAFSGRNCRSIRHQQRKHRSLSAFLPSRRFRSVLDIGCRLSAFTRKIAPLADRVLGTERM
jgi:hypothetical protein